MNEPKEIGVIPLVTTQSIRHLDIERYPPQVSMATDYRVRLYDLILPLHLTPTLSLPPLNELFDPRRSYIWLNIRNINLDLIIISKPQNTTPSAIRLQNLNISQLPIQTPASTRQSEAPDILLQLAVQDHRVEASAVLTEAEIRVVSYAIIVVCLAVGEDEDGVLQTRIF